MRHVALLIVAAVLCGCATTEGVPTAAPPASQLTVVTPAIDAARAAVAGRLQEGGFTLAQSNMGYEPGQPGGLQSAQRVVFQISLADPNQGFLVIYDLGTSDAAIAAGTDFAGYLHSFGHSNYPSDAQFTLNAIDSALVFFWYSRDRASEPDRADQAFALISSVGQAIEVID